MAWYEIKNFPKLLKFRFGSRNRVNLLREENDPTDIRVNKEHGVSGNETWGNSIKWEDYNPLMVGDAFFDTVEKMRSGDGSVAAILKLIKLPFLRTSWNIVPENPDESDAQNLLIAKVCHEKLVGSRSMYNSWNERLTDILLMYDYGYQVSEKIFEVDTDGFLKYAKFKLRRSKTIRDFLVNQDGSINTVVQEGYKDGRLQTLRIPGPYAQVFSWEKEGDNYWGRSILRPIYKHWFYKEELYRIDAVRLDRWGIGIPRAKIQAGYQMKSMARMALDKMLAALRGHERGFVVHPEEVDIDILMPKGSASDLGLMGSVSHHDLMMFRAVLAQFMATGNQEHGNYGSTRSYADMFLFAMQAAANFIQEEYGRQNIRQFCDFNFNMNGRPYPVLRAADIQKIEIGLLAEATSKFAAAGILTPDDDIESFFRKVYGWPRLPKEFTRVERMARGEDIFGTKSNREGRPNAGDPKPRKVDQGPGEE
jgi:hypothetical protein